MTQPAHPEGLSMLEKRRIEAEILKEVYETVKASHGVEGYDPTLKLDRSQTVMQGACHCDFKYGYGK